MRCLPNMCGWLAAVVVLVTAFTLGSPRESTAYEFDDEQIRAIYEAGQRNDLPAIYAAVFAAIAESPDDAPRIVQDALNLAPHHRDAVIATVTSAFPNFEAEFAKAADGQIPPIEQAEVEDAEKEWSGEFELGGFHSTGNSPRETLSVAGEVIYTPSKWQHQLNATFDFVNDSGTTTQKRLVSFYKPRYNFTDRLYGWGAVRFVDDKDDGFQWQLAEGVGPGYKVVQSETVDLAVEVGVGNRQVRERSEDGGSINNDFVGIFAPQFEWRFAEGAKFTNGGVAFMGPKLQQLQNTTALTVNIIDPLAARLSYQVRYDSNPGEDANTTDTEAKASVVYGF